MKSWSRYVGTLIAVLVALGVTTVHVAAQMDIPPPEKLVQIRVAPVALQAGAAAEAHVVLEIAPPWHINANPASPDYMVPTEIDLSGGAAISGGKPRYPAAKGLKLGFDENELAVWDGQVTLDVPLRAAQNAVNGEHTVKGKLRFQACNDQLCLAPASVPFTITVTITGGVPPGLTSGTPSPGETPADTAAPPPPDTLSSTDAMRTDGFTTGPPPPGTSGSSNALLDNPLARALDKGGLAAFVTLFLIGLALNLTPCVYPMLGVTVSIFGARRAAPPLQVFGLALVYVLGMATMYSVLGLLAAFTGGLFGAFLQNPLVLIGIGVLFVALALSMFGVYEIQLPAAIRERASAVNAVGVAGVFFSGLLVGVFAAPCIGPPVVALLAVVGAKGDPWFGFSSFFVLALGLGAPYLVLGTFSNLLQSLPRSGDWMEWVKRVFGVILLSIGIFYALLAINADLAFWVAPIALVVGGGYLGFIDRHADRRAAFKVFKRIAGAAAVLGGLAIVATMPRQAMAMHDFTPAGLETALAEGKTAMIDFSADWCLPCHKLEQVTFTDPRVIAAARGFATFRADLTRYDSPESETWRKQYRISGVPTVLFIGPDGREVQQTRVEGFLEPDHFLERMERAVRGGGLRAAE